MRKESHSGSLIYVADGSQVKIFPESGSNPPAIGAITDQVNGAYGLFVDGKRDLFVANSATITAYRPGALHPYIVYSDPASPLYVVEDHAGRLYAANRNGTVTEYPPHQSSPDRTLQTPGVEADGINVDDAGNLYVAYRGGSTSGSIEKFPPNSTKGRILGMLLDQPQGLQLDHSGNILVVETGGKQVVDIFPPGSQSPSQVVQATNGVTQVVLREAEDNMYVSNFANDNIYISHYPPGEFQLKVDTGLRGVQGMALSNEER
jgi:DNA-binding beta-propeller fold protein YncE